MGPENSNAGISDPLCSVSSIDEGAKIQPHLSPRVGKVEVAESGSAGDAGQGCDRAGVIGSDVPWLECPACNALTWVITVTE